MVGCRFERFDEDAGDRCAMSQKGRAPRSSHVEICKGTLVSTPRSRPPTCQSERLAYSGTAYNVPLIVLEYTRASRSFIPETLFWFTRLSGVVAAGGITQHGQLQLCGVAIHGIAD